MQSRRTSTAAIIAMLLLAIAACGGPAPSPTPAPVTTAEGAVEAVRARTPLFDGVGPKRDDLVGQAAWWTATQAGDAWAVTIDAGWGDCESGCIDRHEWTWTVGGDGSVTFDREQGTPLPEDVLAGLHGAAASQGAGGQVVAGPVCPVEQPGDPSCAPRPVGGATLVVQDAAGKEAARFTTDASGLFRIALEPGAYTLAPQPVEGYMGGAAPVGFDVLAGAETWLGIAYDTGIR